MAPPARPAAAALRGLPRRLLLDVVCASLAISSVVAVDRSKFRTCQQGSFCRRYREYVTEVDKSQGSKFAHALDAGSLEHSGHVVKARLVHVNDPQVKPLVVELKWFKDVVEGRCGIARIFVTEERPLHPRFVLQEGDVVVREGELPADAVTVSSSPEGTTSITSSAPGDCTATIRHKPFELSFARGGRVLQRINGRHLLNFESYRERNAPQHAGLVDATDVNSADLWEESFGGHKDTKPRGPAAVGVDVSFEAANDVVGLAEHMSKLGLGENGFAEPYRFFNLDVFEYATDVEMALYGAVPFVTAVHQRPGGAEASGFFFANPSEGFVKVDAPKQGGLMSGLGAKDESTKTWWLFESGVIDAFVLSGPTPQAVLQQYHSVTGWGRMPPISTLGKHQSRWNYVDVEDSIGVNRKFDQNDIPYDVLWLDIEHTDSKKYFTWHPSHFAKPDELLDAINASKRKLVTIVDPHIKRDTGYDVYNTMKNLDHFTKTHAGAQYEGWCWPGTSLYPDFCSPAVRNQWAKFFSLDYYPHNRPDLYTWNDMNEPSVFNGPEVSMPRDNLHRCSTDGYGVEHRDVHNVYGFYHHMATVQGQLERAPNVRPFVLTRSFFAGSHRHGAVWTGDNMAKWEHLERSVPMLVSLSLCGIGFAGADVPGFFFDPSPELFKRWHQLGIWYPFYRGHAHLETKRREPWVFGNDVTAMVRDQVTARYQLLPTWYTLFAEWAFAGLPILRPTWYHHLDDAAAFRHVDDQFLVGESILVRAINENEDRQAKAGVYLPGGSWFDYWDPTVEAQEGGKLVSVALHPGRVPVYVRSGHVLFKKMRRRRSVGAMASDPYSICVFGPEARGRVYLDDGDSHGYQLGEFVYDELVFKDSVLRSRPAPALPALRGTERQHAPFQAAQRRVERIVLAGLPQQPQGARVVHESGAADPVEIRTAQAAGGTFVATVKKPTGLLGEPWSLELTF